MSFKYFAQRLLALLILGGALLFGMSGVYHEAPPTIRPLFGGVKVDIAGKRIPADTETITVKITEQDLPKLDHLTALRSADLRGSTCHEAIAAWAAAHPQVEVRFSVPLSRTVSVDSDAPELNLSWLRSENVEEAARGLRYLRGLRRVSFGELGGENVPLEAMSRLREALPQVDFDFTVVLGGRSYDGETESLDFRDMAWMRDSDGRERSPAEIEELAEALSCMNRLRSIDFGSERDGEMNWDYLARLKKSCKQVDFLYSFTLYSEPVTLDVEKLDYRGVRLKDNGEALKKALPCMNRCAYVDMDSTGIAYEELDRLRDKCPNTKIIWRVWFGENYSVRTDVERILASKPTVGGMITDASCLKYCRDVKYLDLGHNDELKDLSFVKNMPKLEVLIVAMTGIQDISPLQSCPKLEYLELNSTQVADLRPLEQSYGLHHLNIANCPKIKDITPLYGLTALERLWIGRDTPVPAEQAKKMKELVPACKVNTTADDPHGDAWRFTDYDPEIPKYYWVPRYELLREQLGYNYQEYSFYWLDPLCDKEVPDEYRGMFGKEVNGQ